MEELEERMYHETLEQNETKEETGKQHG